MSEFVLVLVLSLGPAAGCHRSQSPTEGPKPVEVKATDGPVEITVRATKGQILVAEKLKLTIDVIAPDDVDVELPKLDDQIGEFRIRRHRDEPPIPTDRGRRWRQEYELDQLLAGTYEIPSITVKYTDHRSAKPATSQHSTPSTQHSALSTHHLSSPPLSIKVISSIEGDFEPEKFKDIRGTVELPAPRSRAWIYWATGASVVTLVAAGLWLYLRRRSTVAHLPPPIPPHIWAKEELRRLREEELPEQGLVHELYFRMTGIVRQYIEKRFRIMAAEQTTEEFLAAARSHPSLVEEHRGSLARFLQAGDMVKFARYTPEPSEIDQAFGAAETFVDQTATQTGPPASPVEPAPAAGPEVRR